MHNVRVGTRTSYVEDHAVRVHYVANQNQTTVDFNYHNLDFGLHLASSDRSMGFWIEVNWFRSGLETSSHALHA